MYVKKQKQQFMNLLDVYFSDLQIPSQSNNYNIRKGPENKI
jgi:hypothetical protein